MYNYGNCIDSVRIILTVTFLYWPGKGGEVRSCIQHGNRDRLRIRDEPIFLCKQGDMGRRSGIRLTWTDKDKVIDKIDRRGEGSLGAFPDCFFKIIQCKVLEKE